MSGLKTIKRGDSRFYVDPATKEKVPGVTSILNMIPKPFLGPWNAKLTAETAIDNIGQMVSLAMSDRQGAIDFLKGAPRRFTAGAADVGTEVHNMFERIARGESVGRVHPDYEPYVRHIEDFNERYQPEYLFLEETVWSNTHRYAGSFDFMAVIEGETVMGDVKTTRSGVHEEVALQLSAYAFADRIVTQGGTEHELPDIHAGAVVHLRPEGWKLVPARVDEEVFNAFLVCRQMFDLVKETLDTVIGDPVYDSQAQTSTGSQRRASKRR